MRLLDLQPSASVHVLGKASTLQPGVMAQAVRLWPGRNGVRCWLVCTVHMAALMQADCSGDSTCTGGADGPGVYRIMFMGWPLLWAMDLKESG